MSTRPIRVVVLDDYLDVVTRCADWSALPADVVTVSRHIDAEDELVAVLADAEVVVATRERTRLPRSVLERLPRLRLLVTTGMRNAAIDIDAAAERGVLVCGTRGNKSSTAELAWGLILAMLRDIPGQERSLRAGRWHTRIGVSLEGKTLGLLGLGDIGSRMARIAHAFDMNVVAWSANLTDERAIEYGARRVQRDELFAVADVVSIHLVLGDRTRGLVGARELALMKPTSHLVNTSRAEIVDTAALVAALEAGTIAGAAVDVFDLEPAPGDTPLSGAPNTVLTPHLGYVTVEEYRLFYGDVVADIAAWLAGSPVRTLNDPPASAERGRAPGRKP